MPNGDYRCGTRFRSRPRFLVFASARVMPKRGAEERGEAGNSPEAKRRSDYQGFRSLVLEELARDNPGKSYRWRVGEVRIFVSTFPFSVLNLTIS